YKRADEVHVGRPAKASPDLAKRQNTRALSALAQFVVCKERLDLHSRVSFRSRPEIEHPGRPPKGEVLSGEHRIHASVDRPVKRFVNGPAFGCRCRSRRNRKT